MFENQNVDAVHQKILKNISDDYEKSIGYPTADITKSFAIEVADIYSALSKIINILNVDNLSSYDLERYVYQRKGISKLPGSYAKTQLTVNGNGTIAAGDKFQTASGIQFACIDRSAIINGTGIINIQCLEVGTVGMVGANSITQMPVTIPGITSCTNLSPTVDGYEPETDEHLRQRYYEAIRKPPTSGNKYHYLKWAKEVTGVGNAIVYPTWNGDNTVKVVIVDANNQPADSNLVDKVQDYIDPKGENNALWGTGSGEAPLGAFCTAESATAKEITIKVKIMKINNYTDEEVKANISNNIKKYFSEIALNKNNYISSAKIGNLIITAVGVNDYSNLMINDTTNNVELSLTSKLTEVPVLTEVVLL